MQVISAIISSIYNSTALNEAELGGLISNLCTYDIQLPNTT